MLTGKKKFIMNAARDLVAETYLKIQKDGGEYVMMLCDLTSPVGAVVAKLNAEFKQEEGNDLWIYALEKQEFLDLMNEAGMADTKDRLKPGEQQMVLFSDGAPHWFTIDEPNKKHWTSIHKRDLLS